ncbi:hypothetical protein H4W23_24655 [Streptomyces gardneri]|uniref:hypothetical protein n=1 Tax=Streptomyces gardneri TaxID=66892 RepID=UPI00099EE21D|nr:hypothetical protein [Streptomyces gardneri]QPK47506.1 hypothetical protein H4W23_24655 [Streptomyces gardneri]WRK38940.1 hypothetical protein U0M97_24760 [Streptomyces venezuelae]
MLLHEFRPGRLLVGLTALTLVAVYAGDLAGAWTAPWYGVVPVLCAGLGTAGFAGWLSYEIRRRRSARSLSADSSDAPASSSGSQAIK